MVVSFEVIGAQLGFAEVEPVVVEQQAIELVELVTELDLFSATLWHLEPHHRHRLQSLHLLRHHPPNLRFRHRYRRHLHPHLRVWDRLVPTLGLV